MVHKITEAYQYKNWTAVFKNEHGQIVVNGDFFDWVESLEDAQKEIEKLRAENKLLRKACDTGMDFIVEDMRLIQNFEEFIRKSGKIEISHSPGSFHISSKLRSSTNGDFSKCLSYLLREQAE